MESIEALENNIKLWNDKVLKLKDQQEITKNYLTNSINNLQIANEHLQKMEIFMADANANPKFINQIMTGFENEQELRKYLPFMIQTLKLLSNKPNLVFVNKLFKMVNDPNTNSIIAWSKSGTSFFIKDKELLQDYVQERLNIIIKTFYKSLNDFGFRCVDKFLCEYSHEHFQRDNKYMLKYITSMRKIPTVKRIMQSDMEEELKRLKFFQDKLKVNISNIKEKEQITKCDVLSVKRCLENASEIIAQKAKEERRVELPSVDPQQQADEIRKLKQDDGGQQGLGSIKNGVNADIEKISQYLNKLNVQILNLEQGYPFIEDQLAAIERMLPGTDKKLEEIASSMNKLFINPKANLRKRSQESNKNLESETKKACIHSSESPGQATNANSRIANNEELTSNFEAQELSNIFHYLMENDTFPDTDVNHDDLMPWIKALEG
ncbi:hypothetical protein QVD17_25913 [Tagetes erecta]|uniref:HSF-type DNA-binding domain-containing protein n=1 Tax=Tagetes erecta TaxID=13708 RepID=A0AAD8K8B6_TARER|nr:hypothetical protein QVD17_25913 [Tagetes erecta]